MRVLVAGASGAVGMPVVRLLCRAGHEVIALHRRPGSRPRLAETGAVPVQADVLDRTGLIRALDGQRTDAVIAALTAPATIFGRHDGTDAASRLRTESTANLLAAARQLGALRFLTASTVFGYGLGDRVGRVLTEADPFATPGRRWFEAHLAAVRANEQQVLGAEGIDGIALRYGCCYGRGASDALVAGLRGQRQPVPRASGRLPWIFVDDAATATIAALILGERGTAYNITDDEPVSMTVMLTAMAEAIGAPRPRAVPGWLLAAAPFAKAIAADLRVSNAKAKAELDWTLQAPTYRDDLRLLARHYQP